MPEAGLRVTVVWSPAPRQVVERLLELPPGAQVGTALHAAGLGGMDDMPPERIGVWGRQAPLSQPLRDHDRVELYRPLRVDPKVARRARFQKQGARGAGLFAQKRAGAKAGY